MSFLPVLSPVALAVLAVVILACGIAALRRSGATLWRGAALVSAGLLLIVAGARPVFGADPQPRPVGDGEPNVFVLLDRSPQMQSDIGAARADAAALIDRYPRARFAVISFAAEPALDWPLSADTWSLRPLLQATRPDTGTPDTAARANAGAAATVLRYQLISARQQYPRAANLVFYLGAGAPGSDLPTRTFDLPAGSVTGGAVLGYGAPATDTLRRIAGQIGVPYRPRADAAPLAAVLPAVDGDERPTPAPSPARPTEVYWLPAGIAAALLLAELVLILRDFRRTRAVPR